VARLRGRLLLSAGDEHERVGDLAAGDRGGKFSRTFSSRTFFKRKKPAASATAKPAEEI
jgi:hypothetical protein